MSTALMYSFAQRSDTTIVDEPLYAAYLVRTGFRHPGRDVVIASQQHDAAAVVSDVILGDCATDVLFVKSMAHHLDGIDSAFLGSTINVILTRDPEEMLPSLVNQIPEPTLFDTALKHQVDMLNALCDAGHCPPVLDSRLLLLDPEKVLRKLCERLGIPFVASMLEWPAGPRPEDGAWAPFWYHSVHTSTTFARYERKSAAFPERLRPLLAECKPYYDILLDYAIRPTE